MRCSTGIPVVALFLVATTGMNMGRCPGPVAQEVVHVPGYEESHTPGAPGVVVSPKVQQVVGAEADLNRVTVVRTYQERPSLARPKAVLILVPGFLGGAATFTPLAEQLVARFHGAIEVWAVDRRPNQLEDRRGALHAAAGTPDALAEGVRFYFPESDLDGDGEPDGAFELPDAFDGTPRSFVGLAQDDVRFMAHWGVDTYARDWKILVDRARAVVGPKGLVLFGGHSQGTSWTGLFAGYDFDPHPDRVDAAYEKLDGLILLEGGGLGAGSATPPTRDEYLERVAALESAGGPDVYLQSLFFILPVVDLGAGGELSGIAGTFDPSSPSIVQRSIPFGGILSIFIQTPATNRSLVGFFLDDDFSANAAFRASLGFSDDGDNRFNFEIDAYVPQDPGFARQWKDSDDPTLPVCGPGDDFTISPGCAIIDNGPRPAPTDPPERWGVEAEVTALDELLSLTFRNGNFSEWYFMEGRRQLDFAYGRDSSSLGDENLLAVTQTANIDLPVLCIGGSNGLTPTEASFRSYLDALATPPEDQRIEILEGYAHLDVLTAADNGSVPILAEWIGELLIQRARRPHP